jgi:hypothetical protein
MCSNPFCLPASLPINTSSLETITQHTSRDHWRPCTLFSQFPKCFRMPAFAHAQTFRQLVVCRIHTRACLFTHTLPAYLVLYSPILESLFCHPHPSKNKECTYTPSSAGPLISVTSSLVTCKKSRHPLMQSSGIRLFHSACLSNYVRTSALSHACAYIQPCLCSCRCILHNLMYAWLYTYSSVR